MTGGPMSTLEFLGAELRRARRERGLSQEDLAQRISYSSSLVGMVEIGHRTPSQDFITRADAALAAGGLFERLLALVRADSAPPWLREWISVEREATLIRWFEPSLIPGLLQTEAYARAVLEWGGLLRPPEVEQSLTSRMERQGVLLRDSAPQFIALVDEAALRRVVGEPALMVEQFEHLLKVTGMPHVHVHVVPAGAGAHAGLAGPFILARTPEGLDVAHLDNQLRAQVTDRPEDVDTLQRKWETVRGEALPRRASRDFIQELAKSWI
ncbi:Scr1 family TA system antitoxin-like transcriptional regulator [Micromonospora sp. SCSIO 07396]